MLQPIMSTSVLTQSMVQSTASLCGGLSTSGPSDNDTEVPSMPDQSKQIAYTIWIYMGPVIFFVGLTGNVLILVVMSCKRMRGTSTSDYLIIMAVADLLTIITGMIPEWLEAMEIVILQESSPAMCKIYKFVSYMCGDTATWIRVLFTLDRFMAICFPMKKPECCLAWRAKFYCLGAALAAIAKNFHVFWTRGAEYQTTTVYEYVDCVKVPTNNTITSLKQNCGYPTPEYKYFEIYVRPWIVFALVNFIPFCIILVCNIFIVRAMIHMTRKRKERRLPTKTSDWQLFQTTAMCLGASFTFLICVTPTMVVLIGKPYWTKNGTNMAYEISKSVSNQLLYLNNSVNFFLYCITGKKFRETLGLMLRCRCKEVMCKSDASASRLATVRPGSVAAGMIATGVTGARGECNGRQNSKSDSYSGQNSVQSVGFDVQSLGKRTVLDKLEENVVVEATNSGKIVVEKEEAILVEDVVMTQLVENAGESEKSGDQTSARKRTGSESSSGVSSSTSNGEPSPTTLNPDNAVGNGSQNTCCTSTNPCFKKDQGSLNDQCHAEEQCRNRDQCNEVEHGDTKSSCSTEEHCTSEEHCSTERRCSSVDKDPEGHNLTHVLTPDRDLTFDHSSVKDRGLATDHGLVIIQYSNNVPPDITNSLVRDRTNPSARDSCTRSPTSSKLVKNETTPNVSSFIADNCEHQISLESMNRDGDSEENTSQKSWEEQNNDLEKIKTNNSRSIGIENNNFSDVSDAESSEKLVRTVRWDDAVRGNAECKKRETVHELRLCGTPRKYTQDEILDELPETIC